MSRMTDQLVIPRKSWSTSSNHKPVNRSLIINNAGIPYFIELDSKTRSTTTVVPARKVPVLYYISRNGHLEHPHLIDVPLSSSHGLYLRDVMNALNHHRGKRIASMYSWSFKRSYKNGYVWHDALENDLIQPINGHDYVIKGSELLEINASQNQSEISDKCSSMVIKRNQSWSSFDNPQEYLSLKSESNRDLAAKFAPDAIVGQRREQVTLDVSSEDILSPLPSNSSAEVSVKTTGSGYVNQMVKVRDRAQMIENQHGANSRIKASHILIQMITCSGDSLRNVSPVKSNKDQ